MGANCLHLTQNKEIEDLLYFKGIINKYHIKLNTYDSEDNIMNLKVILSIMQ